MMYIIFEECVICGTASFLRKLKMRHQAGKCAKFFKSLERKILLKFYLRSVKAIVAVCLCKTFTVISLCILPLMF